MVGVTSGEKRVFKNREHSTTTATTTATAVACDAPRDKSYDTERFKMVSSSIRDTWAKACTVEQFLSVSVECVL
jgi:hypothetical protein